MFYSNCLFETIKHKIKDWKNVKITYIPARYNTCFCPHFLWSDGKHDYDFGVERYLRWYERFWFKGEIRTRKLGFNQKWKAYLIATKGKKCGIYRFLPIINKRQTLNSSHLFYT